MSADAKLLPCPFCGGPASFGTVKYSPKHVQEQGWNQDTFHFVSCIKCGVSNCGIVGHDTMILAAELWNHRELIEQREADEPVTAREAEPVAWTGSGSIAAMAYGREGFIWPSKADAHPIPLYTHPAPLPVEAAAQVLLDADKAMPLEAKLAAVRATTLREGKARPVTIIEAWRAALHALAALQRKEGEA